MRLSFLEPVYTEPGPFASVYLDTSRDIEDPERAIALRWRHLRDDLASQGADPASIATLAEAVGSDADVPGMHGQAVFTAHGALALEGELPTPPAHDSARFGTLPDTMPLVLQRAPGIPYLAVNVHYMGLPTADTAGTVTVDAEAGVWPTTKVTPGERLHRSVPVSEWHAGAGRLGRQLDLWARRTDADVVPLGGDEWARNVLVRRLPDGLRRRVVTVSGPAWGGTRRTLLEGALDILFGGRMAAHDRGLVDVFLARRARHGGAAEGLAAVVAALQRSQVEALLLNHAPESAQRIWVGPDPTQLALTEDELCSFGVERRSSERADAALVRALVGTGAELVVVPLDRLRLRDGVGVLLRYVDAATAA